MGRVWKSMGLLALLTGIILIVSSVSTITGLAIDEGLAGSISSGLGAVFVLLGVLFFMASMKFD